MWKIMMTLVILTGTVMGQVPDFDSPHHPSRVLVRFKPGVPEIAKQQTHVTAGAVQVLEEYPTFDGLQLVEIPEGNVAETVMAYLDNPNVVNAAPDYERYPVAVCNSNDPYLLTGNYLWGLTTVPL